jgi:7-cyano-7-deazaguanine synthase
MRLKMKTKAVVLVSGGMDSLITAAIARKECDEIYFLHLNYGQKAQIKELESFLKMKEYFKPEDFLIIDVDYLKKIGGSSLTDEKIPVKDYTGSREVPDSYVPFRNAHLLTIAVSWAEVRGANRIYIGAVEEDSSGYPDCREKFYEAMEQAIDKGTKDETRIKIITPVIHKKKSEIVKIGKKLGVPFELSWSCYENNEKACGKCDSCYLRIKAFKEAGIKDPIHYDIHIDWGKDSHRQTQTNTDKRR